MADDTQQTDAPTPVGVFTCYDPINPALSCYGLVENDPDVRRKHREWHADRHAKDEGQRKAIKARDEEIARLHEAIGRYEKAVEGFQGEVSRVETPAPAIPIVIDRSGYTEAEVAATPVELDDEVDLPVTPDFLAALPPQPTAAEEAEDDEDDDRQHRSTYIADEANVLHSGERRF